MNRMAPILVILPCIAFAASSVPERTKFSSKFKFEDFAVTEIYKGTPKLDLSSDKDAKRFKGALRHAQKQGVNFAGHFYIAEWGCGTNCAQSLVVDAQTGKIYSGLDASCGLNYRKDSGLMIKGMPEDGYFEAHSKGAVNCVPEIYVWKNHSFKKLQSGNEPS